MLLFKCTDDYANKRANSFVKMPKYWFLYAIVSTYCFEYLVKEKNIRYCGRRRVLDKLAIASNQGATFYRPHSICVLYQNGFLEGKKPDTEAGKSSERCSSRNEYRSDEPYVELCNFYAI